MINFKITCIFAREILLCVIMEVSNISRVITLSIFVVLSLLLLPEENGSYESCSPHFSVGV